jgi:hypothetical protein
MRRLNSFESRMKFVAAITLFSMATLAFVGGGTAKQWVQVQKAVQVQSTCTKGNGKTTVIARPFGSEGDKYVCVGECRVVRMCLLEYCYNETVCDPCARVVVVMGK